jgi:ubiquinone/menaquinone biosynthesis C-methylase UbiE
MDSLSFDRAADYYDRTRGLPPEVMDQLIPVLARHIGPGHSCLEIGAGTGRFTIPLARAGIDMTAIDLAPAMLEKLASRRGEGASVSIAFADATALPFASGSFDAGLACHVFHLIPEWQRAVDELVRAVGPGGKILHDFGDFGHYEWADILEFFLDSAGAENRHRGANDVGEVDEHMIAKGLRLIGEEVVPATRTSTYARSIGAMEKGIFSITWDIPEDRRSRAADATRAWVTARLGDLDEERQIHFDVTWKIYEVPATA